MIEPRQSIIMWTKMHTTWTKRQLANCIVQSLHQTKHRNPTSQSCHPAPTAPKPN